MRWIDKWWTARVAERKTRQFVMLVLLAGVPMLCHAHAVSARSETDHRMTAGNSRHTQTQIQRKPGSRLAVDRSQGADTIQAMAKKPQSHRAMRATGMAASRVASPRHGATQRAPEPTELAERPLIVIDPGHGGRDPGAIGASGTPEKTITLATARELRRALEATGRYRIALTRTDDRTVSLGARLAFARKHDADLFIAIHADASRDRRARGASVYVSSSDGTARFSDDRSNSNRIARALAAPEARPEPTSAWLQNAMIEQLADDVRMVAKPARSAHLYVLGSRTVPSVLLEMGFMSNRRDEALLGKPSHRDVLVKAIKDAIDDYFAGIKSPSSRT